MRHRLVILLVSTITLPATSGSAVAQETHTEVLQRMAVGCVGSVPARLDSFVVEPGEKAPYIRSSVSNYWIEQGKTIFANDTDSPPDGLPVMAYTVDRAEISFGKSRSGLIPRRVVLGVRYILKGPQAQILADSRCDDTRSDTLTTEMARLFKDDRYAETNVLPSTTRWYRKVLEPAIVIGVAAVGTYLFFNLRSERASDG
jgi:hypothetical protein